ncbi:MAG: hypothetical protein WCC25_20575 [Candidatus Korobacteraceae bacterium]
MRIIKCVLIFSILSLMVLLIPASAEVVYTPVNVSIPVNNFYVIDLNHDGVTDFILRSELQQDYCLGGNGYAWNLGITPARGDAVVVARSYYAAALLRGVRVDGSQNLFPSTALMSELEWGPCGQGLYGEWMNLPNRYLGLQFRPHGSNDIHHGWAQVSTVAYVDDHGHLHASTILMGFAHETVAGRGIPTGQTSELRDDSAQSSGLRTLPVGGVL